MASKCGRFFNRSSVSSVKSAFSKPNASSFNRASTASFAKPPPPSAPAPSAFRRFSVSRSPAELRAAASMLPLHSTVATARMTSCLSLSSRSCRALSQDETDGT